MPILQDCCYNRLEEPNIVGAFLKLKFFFVQPVLNVGSKNKVNAWASISFYLISIILKFNDNAWTFDFFN